ncbi:hypothetical protein Tco_0409107, partial [Tanacetum coccineum]
VNKATIRALKNVEAIELLHRVDKCDCGGVVLHAILL